ncbi:MAG: DUF72 domain-containing protein [Spirochaetales bacterium]|jgi:uncharacterized protein YecE (DUF72 family)|nr:DUF72 domain-containing protein [Exilispira sp.]NMC68364.1 DUF72 domain-containing protein [Spirochaetales bacterium]
MDYYIGTAGFSYRDWEGIFYPKAKDKLEYYSSIFNFVEINSTFYSIPEKQFFTSFSKRLKKDFMVSIKANKTFTHQNNWSSNELISFFELTKILEDKLLCILFQFPYSFHNDKENLKKIENIKKLSSNINIAIEVRHKSFMEDTFLNFCKDNNLIFVNIDQPQISYNLSLTTICTNDKISYFRFHGRKKDTWFSDNIESYERYNYTYTEKEIDELKDAIVKNKSEKIIISFNNHYKAKAVINAIELMEKLGKKPIVSSNQIKKNLNKSNESLL